MWVAWGSLDIRIIEVLPEMNPRTVERARLCGMVKQKLLRMVKCNVRLFPQCDL